MSTKELVYRYIDRLNESQLNAIIAVLRQFDIPMHEEIEPDEWDMEMIKRAEAENDGETVSIEELTRNLGIDYGSL